MRKVIFPVAFIGVTSLVACSFEMQAGSKPPQQPGQPPAAAPPPAASPAAPAATTTHGGAVKKLGRAPAPTPSSSSTTPAPTPTTPPAGAQIVTGATIFGSGTVDATSYKGSIFWIDNTTTKVPPLGTMKPAGFLFTSTINVTPQAFTSGFPGVDANRKSNFAIRYEAPLIVTTEADVTFRIVADDGANLLIDNTPIVSNDGVKAAPAEATGPVHLVTGTHLITIDYFVTTGNVALQVFCKRGTDAEAPCPTRL